MIAKEIQTTPMPADFHVIDLYRDLCQTTSDSDIMMNTDQQVPQTSPREEAALVTVKIEPGLTVNPYDFTNSILEEIQATQLPAPSAGCTTVTEVPDQQLNGGNSPPHFLDLDLYSDTDHTMYDQMTTDVKPSSQPFFLPSPTTETMDEEIDNVLYYLATKDILDECTTLDLSPDPTRWSIQDVGKWITHMCKKYRIPDVTLDLFQMNGKCVCLLSESDFIWRSRTGGAQLYAQLEIWKNYFRVEDLQDQVYFQPDRYVGDNELGRHCTSPYSLSPDSPGSSSLDSSSSSLGSSPSRNQTLDDAIFTYRTNIQDKPVKTEAVSPRPTEHKQTIHLWQFLKELLLKPESFISCIKWVDRSKGIFKIEDSSRVAKEWGRRKNRPAMNYDKLSRSIRQYYKKGIIKKTEHSKRLVYQFCAPYL